MYLNETDYMQKKRAEATIKSIDAKLKMPGYKEHYKVLKTRRGKWAKILKDLDAKNTKAEAEAKKASSNPRDGC